jgi:hypothetical protein
MARPFTHDPRYDISFSDGLSGGPCGWYKMTSLSWNKRRVPFMYITSSHANRRKYMHAKPKMMSMSQLIRFVNSFSFSFSLLNIS